MTELEALKDKPLSVGDRRSFGEISTSDKIEPDTQMVWTGYVWAHPESEQGRRALKEKP